jgi:WD40 repeat protein
LAVGSQRYDDDPFASRTSITLWPVDSRDSPIRTSEGFEGFFTAIAFAPRGRMLVSSGCVLAGHSVTGLVQFWDSRTGAMVRHFEIADAAPHAIAVSPDGRLVAIGTAGSTSRTEIRDMESLRQVAVLNGHEDRVASLAFSPDGKYLLSSGRGKLVHVWNTARWAEERTLDIGISSDTVVTVSASPKGCVAALCDGNECFIVAYDSGARLHTLSGSPQSMTFARFTHDGTHVITCGLESTYLEMNKLPPAAELPPLSIVRLWDVQTGREVCATRIGDVSRVHSLACSPVEPAFATTESFGNAVQLWSYGPLNGKVGR